MVYLKIMSSRMFIPTIMTFRTLMAPLKAQIHTVSAASQLFFRAEPKCLNLCWPWLVCHAKVRCHTFASNSRRLVELCL